MFRKNVVRKPETNKHPALIGKSGSWASDLPIPREHLGDVFNLLKLGVFYEDRVQLVV